MTLQGPFIDLCGPCPVHLMSSHTWGDCFNNPKNKALDGPNNNAQHGKNHGQGYFYLTRGWEQGHGYGHHFYSAPHIPNPFPTLYIEQAPTNAPMDALSMVSNTNNCNMSNNQTYDVKDIQKPNRGEIHSQWLYHDAVDCETVQIKDFTCCESSNS